MAHAPRLPLFSFVVDFDQNYAAINRAMPRSAGAALRVPTSGPPPAFKRASCSLDSGVFCIYAKVISVPIVFLWNYAMARFWVFRGKPVSL
jgi:hypothetical protein